MKDQPSSPKKPLPAVGCDVVAIERLERWLKHRGFKGLNRVLTESELAYCQSAGRLPQQAGRVAAKIAVRLAAKEATAKLLELGLNGLGYSQGLPCHSIEVMAASEGNGPKLQLSGKALQAAHKQGYTHWQVSLSHDAPVAMAVVLAC